MSVMDISVPIIFASHIDKARYSIPLIKNDKAFAFTPLNTHLIFSLTISIYSSRYCVYLRASAPAFFIVARYILMMGEASGGCHFVSLGSSCQVYGRCTTSPGFFAVPSTDNASRSTCRCPPVSFTSPTTRP